MANVVASGAYATDVIATQRMYFNQSWGIGYQLLLCLSSQLIGFAFAGMVRRFLVWPSAMLYPGVLVNCALFNTLHKSYGKREKGHMSRERFFLNAMLASFVWYWFPGYIFTALSIFNWVCWIAPNNVVINQLFGYQTGLGMGFLTFDWSMISYIGSPLVVPVRIVSLQMTILQCAHHEFSLNSGGHKSTRLRRSCSSTGSSLPSCTTRMCSLPNSFQCRHRSRLITQECRTTRVQSFRTVLSAKSFMKRTRRSSSRSRLRSSTLSPLPRQPRLSSILIVSHLTLGLNVFLLSFE